MASSKSGSRTKDPPKKKRPSTDLKKLSNTNTPKTKAPKGPNGDSTVDRNRKHRQRHDAVYQQTHRMKKDQVFIDASAEEQESLKEEVRKAVFSLYPEEGGKLMDPKPTPRETMLRILDKFANKKAKSNNKQADDEGAEDEEKGGEESDEKDGMGGDETPSKGMNESVAAAFADTPNDGIETADAEGEEAETDNSKDVDDDNSDTLSNLDSGDFNTPLGFSSNRNSMAGTGKGKGIKFDMKGRQSNITPTDRAQSSEKSMTDTPTFSRSMVSPPNNAPIKFNLLGQSVTPDGRAQSLQGLLKNNYAGPETIRYGQEPKNSNLPFYKYSALHDPDLVAYRIAMIEIKGLGSVMKTHFNRDIYKGVAVPEKVVVTFVDNSKVAQRIAATAITDHAARIQNAQHVPQLFPRVPQSSSIANNQAMEKLPRLVPFQGKGKDDPKLQIWQCAIQEIDPELLKNGVEVKMQTMSWGLLRAQFRRDIYSEAPPPDTVIVKFGKSLPISDKRHTKNKAVEENSANEVQVPVSNEEATTARVGAGQPVLNKAKVPNFDKSTSLQKLPTRRKAITESRTAAEGDDTLEVQLPISKKKAEPAHIAAGKPTPKNRQAPKSMPTKNSPVLKEAATENVGAGGDDTIDAQVPLSDKKATTVRNAAGEPTPKKGQVPKSAPARNLPAINEAIAENFATEGDDDTIEVQVPVSKKATAAHIPLGKPRPKKGQVPKSSSTHKLPVPESSADEGDDTMEVQVPISNKANKTQTKGKNPPPKKTQDPASSKNPSAQNLSVGETVPAENITTERKDTIEVQVPAMSKAIIAPAKTRKETLKKTPGPTVKNTPLAQNVPGSKRASAENATVERNDTVEVQIPVSNNAATAPAIGRKLLPKTAQPPASNAPTLLEQVISKNLNSKQKQDLVSNDAPPSKLPSNDLVPEEGQGLLSDISDPAQLLGRKLLPKPQQNIVPNTPVNNQLPKIMHYNGTNPRKLPAYKYTVVTDPSLFSKKLCAQVIVMGSHDIARTHLKRDVYHNEEVPETVLMKLDYWLRAPGLFQVCRDARGLVKQSAGMNEATPGAQQDLQSANNDHQPANQQVMHQPPKPARPIIIPVKGNIVNPENLAVYGYIMLPTAELYNHKVSVDHMIFTETIPRSHMKRDPFIVQNDPDKVLLGLKKWVSDPAVFEPGIRHPPALASGQHGKVEMAVNHDARSMNNLMTGGIQPGNNGMVIIHDARAIHNPMIGGIHPSNHPNIAMPDIDQQLLSQRLTNHQLHQKQLQIIHQKHLNAQLLAQNFLSQQLINPRMLSVSEIVFIIMNRMTPDPPALHLLLNCRELPKNCQILDPYANEKEDGKLQDLRRQVLLQQVGIIWNMVKEGTVWGVLGGGGGLVVGEVEEVEGGGNAESGQVDNADTTMEDADPVSPHTESVSKVQEANENIENNGQDDIQTNNPTLSPSPPTYKSAFSFRAEVHDAVQNMMFPSSPPEDTSKPFWWDDYQAREAADAESRMEDDTAEPDIELDLDGMEGGELGFEEGLDEIDNFYG